MKSRLAIATAILLAPGIAGAALTAPTSLTATAVSGSAIQLAWSDGNRTEDWFSIERGLDGVSFGEIGTAPRDATGYLSSGLATGVRYYYRVRAINNNNVSTYSNVASAVTPDTVAPGIPASVYATPTSCSQMSISWASVTDTGGSGLRGYNVYRNGIFLKQVLAPSTSTTDTGLAASTIYNYSVSAVDNAGNQSMQRSAQGAATPSCGGDITAPSVPQGLGATPVSCSQVNLSWSASTDAGGSGLKGYNIYRNGAFLKTVLAPATTTSDAGLAASTMYSYRVSAVDNAGNTSTQSTTASAATPACSDTTPPTVPTGLTVTAVSCTQMYLSWNASTDSGGSNVKGYRIYKNNVLITGAPIAATSMYDSVGQSATYSYAVSAVDNANNESARSAAVTRTSPACGTTTTTRPATTTTRPSTTTTTTTRPATTTTTLANQLPVANAGPDQAAQTLISLSFNGSGSYDPDGTIASYAWNFGDGGTASGATAAHTYSVPGTYTVTLTVTDNRGATRSDTATASILNRAPTANAGADKTGTAGTAVSFSGSGSDADGTVSSYAWAFGDGGTATGATVSHVYATGGTHTATLTVTDNRGATGSDTALVTVSGGGGSTPTPWVRTGGGANTQSGYATAVDSGGNVVVGGLFMGTLTLGGTSLTSAGASDGFVAKYSPTGTLLWVRQIGGAGDDIVEGVAVDGGNNVLVTGRFSGTANTQGGTVVSAGGMDILVVKYNSGGGHVWSQRFGGAQNDFGYGIDTDSSGNVYFTGAFSGTVNFGGGARTVPYTSDLDAYLAKLSPGGTYLWDKTFTNNADETAYAVAASPTGEVAIAGIFKGDINFGGGVIRATYQPVARGLNDGFLAKFSASGGYLWARQFGSDREDGAFGVAMDASGNVTVTGQVRGSVNFGAGSTTGSEFEYDAFVAQYSSTGAHRWSRRMGGTLEDVGNDVTVDGSGNATVTGQYRGTSSFGGSAFTSAGALDIFVAQYGPTGTHRWSESWGGTADDRGFGVGAGPSGQVAATGWFKGAATVAGTGVSSVDAWPDACLVQHVP